MPCRWTQHTHSSRGNVALLPLSLNIMVREFNARFCVKDMAVYRGENWRLSFILTCYLQTVNLQISRCSSVKICACLLDLQDKIVCRLKGCLP